MKPCLLFLFLAVSARRIDLINKDSLTSETEEGEDTLTLPLYADQSGFYVNLFFGSHSARQSLILDTGSNLTALPCRSTCQECGRHRNYYYDPSLSLKSKFISCRHNFCQNLRNSKCSSEENCSYSVSYAEGSALGGIVLQDYVRAANKAKKGFPLYFGCHSK